MSLLLGWVIGSAAATAAVCPWEQPGRERYTGGMGAAVDHYTDIPAPVREALKRRMAAHRYDDMAAIRRDSIEGRRRYADLRQMHFGPGRVCATISRAGWAADHVERGLVYCESGHCLIVPTVCGNVSRVTRLGDEVLSVVEGPPPGAGGGAGPVVALPVAPQEPLAATPSATPPAAAEVPPAGGSAPGIATAQAAPGNPGYAPGPGAPIGPSAFTPPLLWLPPTVITDAVPEPPAVWLALLGAGVLGWRLRARLSARRDAA